MSKDILNQWYVDQGKNNFIDSSLDYNGYYFNDEMLNQIYGKITENNQKNSDIIKSILNNDEETINIVLNYLRGKLEGIMNNPEKLIDYSNEIKSLKEENLKLKEEITRITKRLEYDEHKLDYLNTKNYDYPQSDKASNICSIDPGFYFSDSPAND